MGGISCPLIHSKCFAKYDRGAVGNIQNRKQKKRTQPKFHMSVELIFSSVAYHSVLQERSDKFLNEPIFFIILRCKTSTFFLIPWVFFFSHKKNHKKKHHSRHIRFTKLTKLPGLIEKYEYQKYVFEHNFLHNYRRTLKLRSPEYVKCQSGIPFWLRRSQYSKSQVAEVYV